MAVKTKNGGRAMSMAGGLAVGAVVSLTAILTMSAVTAKLVQSGALVEQNVGYAVMVLLLVSSFAGAAAAQGRVKHRRGFVCMLSGGICFLMLLSITALFFGGQYTGVWATGLVVLAGCSTVALMKARRGRGGRKRHHHLHRTQ